MLILRSSKVILAFIVGFWGLVGLFGNLVSIPSTYAEVETVTSMVGVPEGEGPPFGTSHPIVVGLGVLAIILGKVAALVGGIGGVLMARKIRAPIEEFTRAKTLAIAGCGLACAINFAAFNVFAESLFFAFYVSELAMVGPLAFRYSAMFALVALFIAQTEPG